MVHVDADLFSTVNTAVNWIWGCGSMDKEELDRHRGQTVSYLDFWLQKMWTSLTPPCSRVKCNYICLDGSFHGRDYWLSPISEETSKITVWSNKDKFIVYCRSKGHLRLWQNSKYFVKGSQKQHLQVLRCSLRNVFYFLSLLPFIWHIKHLLSCRACLLIRESGW